MLCRKILAAITVFYLSKEVQSYRNYKVNLLSMNVRYVNPELAIVHAAEIKKINRTHTYINVNATTLQECDNATLISQFYQLVSNRYKEFLPKISLEVCPYITQGVKTGGTGFVGNAVAKLKAPFLDIVHQPGQKFPKGCPVRPDNYHVFVHVDEDKLPPFLLPAGRYKVNSELTMKKFTQVFVASVAFEIVNYSSEKQKQLG